MAALPPPRDPDQGVYSLALVCLGNICRSPMAHVVLEHKLAQAGLSSRVVVESSGTDEWHIGDPMDRRAAKTLATAGYRSADHRSRLFTGDWFGRHDAILVMDESNRVDVLRLVTSSADNDRVLMFREFDPEVGDDLAVPDPWYGGPRSFEEVLAIIERTTDSLVAALQTVPKTGPR